MIRIRDAQERRIENTSCRRSHSVYIVSSWAFLVRGYFDSKINDQVVDASMDYELDRTRGIIDTMSL